MTKYIKNNPERLRKIIMINMLLGVALFITMFFLIITGQYANITERLHNEAIMNAVAIGGLLYASFFFLIDTLAVPLLQSDK